MLRDTPQAMLLRTRAGRAFLAAAVVKLALAAAGALLTLPAFLSFIDALATVVLLITISIFIVRLARVARRRLLWRVRRKMILSYIFIGLVPVLLIAAFFLLGGFLLFQNLSAYLFKDGYEHLVEDVQLMAQASALEISRTADSASLRGKGGLADTGTAMLARRRANMQGRYPELSLALVPAGAAGTGEPIAAAGPWRHVAPPASTPQWIVDRQGFSGTLAMVPPDSADEPELIIRSVQLLDGPGTGYAIVVDLPFDGQVIETLRDQTGIRAGDITIRGNDPNGVHPLLGRLRQGAAGLLKPQAARTEAIAPGTSGINRGVVFVDYTDWDKGQTARASVSINMRMRDLYARISAAQPMVNRMSLGDVFLLVLIIIAVLFVIIQLVALTMGVALAKSITSAVHELFAGTERVRQGDFTHRIAVKSQDQLGELASSFNEMTESIEHLLQTEAEKKRLEEELRIAREIQMSLLPRGPLSAPGLEVTALCVPAREVGGDYYDFFRLGDRKVAVLVADVSGKGTSAALYMAELKGILLSLAERHPSPRDLLIEVNRVIAGNLDSRSFITMTYAVLDLEAGTLTYARAGHTPMIYLPAAGPARGHAQVLQPGGLVLGLHIDGIQERFVELLEEQTLPIGRGDVFVLYTDGVTEAMNQESELFGEPRLSRIVEEHGHLRSAELRERILREIESFVGPADQHDDLTLILIKVVEAGAAAAAVA